MEWVPEVFKAPSRTATFRFVVENCELWVGKVATWLPFCVEYEIENGLALPHVTDLKLIVVVVVC